MDCPKTLAEQREQQEEGESTAISGYKPANCKTSMAGPGPYSGTSTLALVARVSAFTLGVVYGSMKLSYLKSKAKSHKITEAKGHH